MGQMKKLWEEQREFGALEDRIDWEELTNTTYQYQTPYEHKTLRPTESTDKWRKLQEIQEGKDEWRLWD
jgi:hypothetical protein